MTIQVVAFAEEPDGAVAKIGDVEYATLEAALTAVEDGETITLLADVKLSKAILFQKAITFTLDGDGHSILPIDGETKIGYHAMEFGNDNGNSVDGDYILQNITFRDFTKNNVTAVVLRLSGPNSVTLNDVTFDNCDVSNGTGSSYSVIRVYNTAFTADHLTVTNCKGGMLVDPGSASGPIYGAATVIQNSTFTDNMVTGAGLIYPKLLLTEGSYLAIRDTLFQGNTVGVAEAPTTGARSIVFFGEVNGEVTGCTFKDNTVYSTHGNCTSGIDNYSGGSFTITGNTFTGGKTYLTASSAGSVGGAPIFLLGDSTLAENTVDNTNQFFHRTSAEEAYTEQPARAVGMYSAKYGTMTILSGDYSGEFVSPSPSFEVSGGTFSSDVTEYCVEGFKAVKNEDGTFGIVEALPAVAKIGDVEYESLAEAIAAAKGSDTITLLAATMPDSGAITVDKSITIVGAPECASVVNDVLLSLASNVSLTLNGIHFTGNSGVVADSVKNAELTMTNCLVEAAYWKYGNLSRAAFILGQHQGSTLKLNLDGNTFMPYTATDSYAAAIFLWNAVVDGSKIINNTFGSPDARFNFVAIKLMNVSDNAEILFDHNTFYGADAYYGTIQIALQHDYPSTFIFKENAFYGAAPAIALMPLNDEATYTKVVGKIGPGNTYNGGPLPADKVVDYGDNHSENTIQWVSNVAKIGDVEYETLADAFAAAKGGDTITLLADITLTEPITVLDSAVLHDILLDGAGYTVTADLDSTQTPLRFGDSSKGRWATGVKIRDLTVTTKEGTQAFCGITFVGGSSSELTNVTVSGNYKYYGINLYGTHGATMTGCDISNSNPGEAAVFANAQTDNPLILKDTKVSLLLMNKYTSGVDFSKPKIFVCEGSTVEQFYAIQDEAFYAANGLTPMSGISIDSDSTVKTVYTNVDNEWKEYVPTPAFTGFSENMLIIPMGEVAGQHQIALIMGIDTLQYSEVGFDVALNGESLGSFKSTTVYRSVKDGAGKVWTPTDPDLGGKAGGYLFTNTMGISNKYSAEDFGEGAVVTVTPYAVTLDGAKMTVNSYDIPIAYFFK